MPALPPYIIELIREQFIALLPERVRSSTGLPPTSCAGRGGLREAGPGFGLRLCLLEDSRRLVLGHHAAS